MVGISLIVEGREYNVKWDKKNNRNRFSYDRFVVIGKNNDRRCLNLIKNYIIFHQSVMEKGGIAALRKTLRQIVDKVYEQIFNNTGIKDETKECVHSF